MCEYVNVRESLHVYVCVLIRMCVSVRVYRHVCECVCVCVCVRVSITLMDCRSSIFLCLTSYRSLRSSSVSSISARKTGGE